MIINNQRILTMIELGPLWGQVDTARGGESSIGANNVGVNLQL